MPQKKHSEYRSVSSESTVRAVIGIIGSPLLRPTALRSVFSVFRNFFFLQYRAALFPGRYPVSQADHPLDKKIPFTPGRVKTYLDFIHFYIRAAGFLIRISRQPGILQERKKAMNLINSFIKSLGAVYGKAAEVYSKNFSTTNRPSYLSSFNFIVIHAFDPHLMCIPSLHVMVMILTYTRFKKILNELNGTDALPAKKASNEVRSGALAITEAVLYIKQHSVNCISAAMYAMTRFDDSFPEEEAEAFAGDLFKNADDMNKKDIDEIRSHIINLYRRFIEQGSRTDIWEKPLLDFLASLQDADALRKRSFMAAPKP